MKDFFFTQTHFFKQLEFSLQTFTLRGAEMLLMPMEAKKEGASLSIQSENLTQVVSALCFSSGDEFTKKRLAAKLIEEG